LTKPTPLKQLKQMLLNLPRRNSTIHSWVMTHWDSEHIRIYLHFELYNHRDLACSLLPVMWYIMDQYIVSLYQYYNIHFIWDLMEASSLKILTILQTAPYLGARSLKPGQSLWARPQI
jgi:hypothetical protein